DRPRHRHHASRRRRLRRGHRRRAPPPDRSARGNDVSPSLLRTTSALIAAAILAIPTAVKAQPRENVYRVGLLLRLPAGDPGSPTIVSQSVDGLRELGYVEGRNLTLERRSTQGSPEQARALADELVRLKVDVIVTGGDREVEIAKQATRTIPIVMAVSGDPV